MLLQAGPIAPSSIGLWAVTFLLGGLVVAVAWLVRRHYKIAVPVYNRVFGRDVDATDDGHIEYSEDRFDTLDSAVGDLRKEIEDIHDDVRTLERRNELVLSNQNAIAEDLGVDLERPRFYREGRGDVGSTDD